MSAILIACDNKEEESPFNMNNLAKVWDGNTIYNETVVLVDDGTEISGKLLFEPTEVISVKDYTLEKSYDQTEYEVKGNKIVRTANSKMPYFTTEQLAGKNLPDGYGLSTYQAKEVGTEIVFTEGIGIVMHQIAVTYKHNGKWAGITPAHQPQYLENTLAKLQNKEEVTIVVNGDSISTGANSSGVLGIKPFQDDFPTILQNYLQNKYQSTVNLINTSVGGTTSAQGKTGVDANVNSYNPDLVIIGYGMNDGTFRVSPQEYKNNIEFMIKSIQARNPNADILVIATMVANPISIQNQIQKDYLDPILDLQETYGVAVLDMTSISETLFETKRGVDVLANNINHPSDFLVRIYAQGLVTVITGD